MKIILVSLFVISNAIGMQPQSKKDCYLAHTEFKALARTCKQKERKRNYGGEFSKELYPDEYARKVCVVHYYHNFLDECRKEAALKNQ